MLAAVVCVPLLRVAWLLACFCTVLLPCFLASLADACALQTLLGTTGVSRSLLQHTVEDRTRCWASSHPPTRHLPASAMLPYQPQDKHLATRCSPTPFHPACPIIPYRSYSRLISSLAHHCLRRVSTRSTLHRSHQLATNVCVSAPNLVATLC